MNKQPSEDAQDDPIDFIIVSRPDYIVLTCPRCKTRVEIKWCDVDVPEYWGDDWGSVNCPECGKEIKLGEYFYD